MNQVIYHFRFADGPEVAISTLPAPSPAPPDAPDWTRLAFHQCPNCPLTPERTPHCPLALQLVPLFASLGALRSYDQVEVHVEMAERSVSKSTTVQRAIGSLMGLLAANSGCPHMDVLKPMANFHLPFATEDETIYRSASMYLLTQYFVQQQGGQPDWQLDGLKASYQALHRVNGAMARRLRCVGEEDGAINALVLLDLLAKALPYSIDDALDQIGCVFGPAGAHGTSAKDGA